MNVILANMGLDELRKELARKQGVVNRRVARIMELQNEMRAAQRYVREIENEIIARKAGVK